MIAARADKFPGALLEVERSAVRSLRAVLAHDLVLLRGEQLAPLGFGPGDRILFGIHVGLRASWR